SPVPLHSWTQPQPRWRAMYPWRNGRSARRMLTVPRYGPSTGCTVTNVRRALWDRAARQGGAARHSIDLAHRGGISAGCPARAADAAHDASRDALALDSSCNGLGTRRRGALVASRWQRRRCRDPRCRLRVALASRRVHGMQADELSRTVDRTLVLPAVDQ